MIKHGRAYLVFAMITAVTVLCFFYYYKEGHKIMSNNSVLTVALPKDWGPLTPPEQSMAMAEQILMAEFEPLVAYDMQGNLIPQIATAWEMSDDLKTIVFTIDTERQFSNGEFISSDAYKKSLEHSLRVASVSSNSAVLDVLNLVEGFEVFKEMGELRGLQAPSPNKFVMKFKKPFRRALAYLSAIRYAIYIVDKDGKYLGTGPYQIVTESDREVYFVKNPYYSQNIAFNNIHIVGLKSQEWSSAICDEKYDVYYNLDINKLDSCGLNRESDIDFTGGAIGGHILINLNGLKGRTFSDPRFRMAMQYLVVRHVLPELPKYLNMKRVSLDPQFVAPLQEGRLSKEEIDNIINEGEKWVPDLIEHSKLKPIDFPTNNKKDLDILKLISDLGVRFTKNSFNFSVQDTSEIYYKTFNYDMMYRGAGFGAQDPDDLYHLLGRDGAISSPTIQRDKIVNILEKGRSAITQDEVSNAYRGLSSEILREVPVIHMGYLREGFLYNHNRVKIKSGSMNALAFNYTQFTPVGWSGGKEVKK